MTITCAVIDAGARYGLHPSWSDLRGIVDFHLFEIDQVEAARLARKYADDPKIKIYPLALFSHDTRLSFTINTHRALNSLFETNNDLLDSNEYMTRDFTPADTSETMARSVDSLFPNADIHFLKLDVEGAEYDILKGAHRTLQASVLGLRSEVLFAPIYKGAAQFGEINKLMQEAGFELLNLDYTGAGNKAGRFTLPGRYGKLMSTDAVWIITNDRLFEKTGALLEHDLIRLATFLMNNNATDLAIDMLIRGRTRHGISFHTYEDDLLFHALRRQILTLFKSLLSVPQIDNEIICGTYRVLFDAEFPIMNKFYESEITA